MWFENARGPWKVGVHRCTCRHLHQLSKQEAGSKKTQAMNAGASNDASGCEEAWDNGLRGIFPSSGLSYTSLASAQLVMGNGWRRLFFFFFFWWLEA